MLISCVSIILGKRQRFRDEFNRSLESITPHAQGIDVESSTGFHIVVQKLTSQDHKDVLSKIFTMSSPRAIRVESPATTSYRVIPHVENPSFFGRETELKQMEHCLVPERERWLNVFSIVGEGGVGKSQLALQFAYRHFSEFNAIFWVSADNESKIAQGFEQIAVEVALV
ncbi:Disease resistance protein RFL1 [Ilyonectria robusta]